MLNLLKSMDVNDDGRSDINFGGTDLVVVFTSVGEIPFLWGPSIVEVKTWQ